MELTKDIRNDAMDVFLHFRGIGDAEGVAFDAALASIPQQGARVPGLLRLALECRDHLYNKQDIDRVRETARELLDMSSPAPARMDPPMEDECCRTDREREASNFVAYSHQHEQKKPGC